MAFLRLGIGDIRSAVKICGNSRRNYIDKLYKLYHNKDAVHATDQMVSLFKIQHDIADNAQ